MQTWRRWERQFRVYFRGAELDKKLTATQTAVLLHVDGPDTLEICETFQFNTPTEGEKGKRNNVESGLTKFRECYNPRKNAVFERRCFSSRNHSEGETTDQWITGLRTKATPCEFGEQRDLLIRDKITFGIRNETTKERLLREANLTLKSAMDICHAAEASQHQMRTMAVKKVITPTDLDIHSIHTKRMQPEQTSTTKTNGEKPLCRYCGDKHGYSVLARHESTNRRNG